MIKSSGKILPYAQSEIMINPFIINCSYLTIDKPDKFLLHFMQFILTHLGKRATKSNTIICKNMAISQKKSSSAYNCSQAKDISMTWGLFEVLSYVPMKITWQNQQSTIQTQSQLLRLINTFQQFNSYGHFTKKIRKQSLQKFPLSKESKSIKNTLCRVLRAISELNNLKLHNSNDIGNTLIITFIMTKYFASNKQGIFVKQKVLQLILQFQMADYNRELRFYYKNVIHLLIHHDKSARHDSDHQISLQITNNYKMNFIKYKKQEQIKQSLQYLKLSVNQRYLNKFNPEILQKEGKRPYSKLNLQYIKQKSKLSLLIVLLIVHRTYMANNLQQLAPRYNLTSNTQVSQSLDK